MISNLFVNKPPISRWFVLTAECLPFLPGEVIVTHVPTASKRIRQRGYDHAQLLARALVREHKLTYLPLLTRAGSARQVGSTRGTRLVQLSDAFRIIQTDRIRGASVLLVDDIVTTGGTLEAAARCLKQSGANQIDAVAFAQKE